MLGEGGNALSATATSGTTGQVLRGQTCADPVFGQVVLTTDVTGILPVAGGGTSFGAYATGDLLYASSANALARLAAVANGSVLISTALGAAPIWGQAFQVGTTSNTGALNDYSGLAVSGGCSFTELTGAAPAFTGFSGGVAGNIAILKNTGTGVATFAHNSGASSVGNKLFNIAITAPTPVAAGGFIAYQYDGTQWQLIGHEQGMWITPPFSSGNFTGSGSMTWTVGAGNVGTYSYKLTGTTLTVVLSLGSTSVGGVPSTGLQVAIPGGFTPTLTVAGFSNYSDAGGALVMWRCFFFQPSGYVLVFDKLGGAVWTASVNSTALNGTLVMLDC